MSNSNTPRSRSRNTQTLQILLQKFAKKYETNVGYSFKDKKTEGDTSMKTTVNDSCNNIISMKNINGTASIERKKDISINIPFLNFSFLKKANHVYLNFESQHKKEVNFSNGDNILTININSNTTEIELADLASESGQNPVPALCRYSKWHTESSDSSTVVHRRRERSKSQYAFSWTKSSSD